MVTTDYTRNLPPLAKQPAIMPVGFTLEMHGAQPRADER